MIFPGNNDPESLHWWSLLSEYPGLDEELEAFDDDPESGVVAAVGLFTMLKLHFWHQLPAAVPDRVAPDHLSDEDIPPGVGGG